MGGNRGSGDGRIALANLPVLMREPGVAAASRFIAVAPSLRTSAHRHVRSLALESSPQAERWLTLRAVLVVAVTVVPQ